MQELTTIKRGRTQPKHVSRKREDRKEKKVSSGVYFYLKPQAAISLCVFKENEKDKEANQA